MTKEELRLLATKISEGTANNAELSLYSAVCEAFQQEAISWPGMETELLNMEQVSWAALKKSELKQSADTSYIPETTKRILPFRTITAIAAAVATIVFGVWFFNAPRSNGDLSSRASKDLNDIAPGHSGATITYANGQVIQLDSAKTGVQINPTSLTYNDGSSVSSSSPGTERSHEMTASTSKGQTYVFTLPDGTKVWLNAATTLKFPSTFAKAKTRNVEVDGEAYFEVFRNKSQPFVVKTKKLGNIPEQEITVLGTQFNVNSYADEGNIKTTLLEGSVRVSSVLSSNGSSLSSNGSSLSSRATSLSSRATAKDLIPNQQAILSSGQITVKQVDAESATDWKNNLFIFEAEELGSIMNRLSRWYGITVQYENAALEKEQFSGSVSRFKNLSVLLEKLELTGNVKFEIRGKTIMVKKK